MAVVETGVKKYVARIRATYVYVGKKSVSESNS